MGTIDLSGVTASRSVRPGATTSLPLAYGSQLGSYRLLESIGHGGEADIWSAWDERRQQVVAIKLLSKRAETVYYGERSSNEFEQQVRVVAGLNHPYVLPLYEFGQNEAYYYFVMRYSCSGSLADLLLQGPLPLFDVLLLTAQITSALSYLHKQSVVHRDLKPGNILMDSQKRVYLGDFGLAKRLALETTPLHTGRGTGAYAPFEQHALQGIMPQSDVYSLGIVIYEMLTGQLPWGGTVYLAEQQYRTQQELPDPREVIPELPETVTYALRQFTAFRWKERPESAAAAFQLLLDASGLTPQEPFSRLHHSPPPLDELLFAAQDANALYHHFQTEWQPGAAAFPARLTHFALMDGVYTRPTLYKTTVAEPLTRFMLRGALAHDYNLSYWWQAIAEPRDKAVICEQTLTHEGDAAAARLFTYLLNEPENTWPMGSFSSQALERLLDIALYAQTWPVRDQAFKLLTLLTPHVQQWQSVGLSPEGDAHLAQLALNGSSQAAQAARLIGRLRSKTAVQALIAAHSSPENRPLVLDALQEIQNSAGHLPRIVPARLRWQLLKQRLHQQWREDSPGFSLPRGVIGLFSGLVVCLFLLLGLFDDQAAWLQDTLLQPYPTSQVVTIVEVNDTSLERYGRWDSWPRSLHADLIEQLNAAGARAIVFDFVFGSVTSEDEILAAAMVEAGNVVQPIPGVGDAIHDQPNHVRYEQYVQPPPTLLAASAAVGSTNVLLDADGIVRRLPTLITVDGERYPSIVLAALQVFLTASEGQLNLPEPESGHLPFAGRDIPVDEHGIMAIHYAGPPRTGQAATFQFVPYHDVLEGAAAPELFRDKIVLVGMTATATTDYYLTPVSRGRLMYGVELLANAIETVWSGRFIRQPHNAITLLTILSLSLGMGWAASRPWQGLGWLLGLGLLYFVAASFLFDRTGLALSLFFPLLGLGLSYGAATAYRLTVTSRRNRELMQLFAARVNPATASAAIAAVQKGEIDLSGRDEELSAVVVQLQGQGSYAAQHGPEALLRLVNHWREFVVAAAFDLDGTVVDLKSDQFLILFNTPLPQPDHPSRTLRAVLTLRTRSHEYQQQLTSQHPERQIGLGCGLHTGHAIVGFTGAAPRYVYTALGEAIQVATELATAAAHGHILLSPALHDKVKGLLGGLPTEMTTIIGIEQPIIAIIPPAS